jgi:predicted outer membrane repeat protein
LVTTELDVVDADDGLISLREAVIAANTNQPFSDAPAGDETGDRVVFRGDVRAEVVLTEGELTITDDVLIRGQSTSLFGEEGITAENSRIFNVDTNEKVRFQAVLLKEGVADNGGLIMANPGSDIVIASSVLREGSATLGGAISIQGGTLRVQSSFFLDNISETSGDFGEGHGGAIYATDSDVTIAGSNFQRNSALDSGGAISTTGGRLHLFSSTFSESRAMDGGAVSSYQTRVVSNSRFGANQSVLAGGAASFHESEVHLLEGSRFANNGIYEDSGSDFEFATHAGGAVYSTFGELYINGARFDDNVSDHGGAILSVGTQAVYRNVTIEDNVAASSGGGLSFSGGRAWVVDSQISDNTVNASSEFDGTGGGVYFSSGAPDQDSILVFRRVTVDGNEAADSGGGIYISSDAKFRLYGSTVEDNVANGAGGGALVNNRADVVIAGSALMNNTASGDEGSGGAILSRGEGNTTLVFDSGIGGNSANAGGAISVADGFTRLADSIVSHNIAQVRGGAASVDAGRLVFIGGTVELNRTIADSFPANEKQGGGAVFVESEAQLYARNGTSFNFNQAMTNGGAIQAYGLVNLNGVELDNNFANNGGAINTAPLSLVFVRNSSMSENSVQEGNGAAILANSESSLIMSDCIFEGNDVVENVRGYPVFRSGGGFFLNTNSTFTSNSPNNEVGFFG